MVRSAFRLVVRLGLVAAAGYVVLRLLQRRVEVTRPVPGPSWPQVTPPRPEPSAAPAAPEPVAAPVEKKAGETKPAPPRDDGAAWVAPSSDGLCPQSHPIRAKLSSKIFHLPGMFAYDRTHPDRCYANPDDAVADGFRQAKR